MNSQFTNNITSLDALGRGLNNDKKVSKILCCLPYSMDTIFIMTFKSKDLSTYLIDHLLSSIIDYK